MSLPTARSGAGRRRFSPRRAMARAASLHAMPLRSAIAFVLLVWLAAAPAPSKAAPRDDLEDPELAELEFFFGKKSLDFSLGLYGESWDGKWLTGRAGLSLVGMEKTGGLYLTAGASVRLCIPASISPYVGFGAALGRGFDDRSESTADYDYNHDGLTDRKADDPYSYIALCYPEAGVRVFLGRAAVSAGVRHLFTTRGGSTNVLQYGGSVNFKF